MKKINYIEYGVGNFLSIKNSLKTIDIDLNIVDKPENFNNELHTLLPGVGNFDYCMQQLAKNNFVEFLRDKTNFKKNLVGICVGMQIMFTKSEEAKEYPGLGIFDGEIVNLKNIGIKQASLGMQGGRRVEKGKKPLKKNLEQIILELVLGAVI